MGVSTGRKKTLGEITKNSPLLTNVVQLPLGTLEVELNY